jgi:hypothetical protein
MSSTEHIEMQIFHESFCRKYKQLQQDIKNNLFVSTVCESIKQIQMNLLPPVSINCTRCAMNKIDIFTSIPKEELKMVFGKKMTAPNYNEAMSSLQSIETFLSSLSASDSHSQ